jgi:hypothetical protein
MIISFGVILSFGYFAMNSRKIIKKMIKSQETFGKIYYKVFGTATEKMHTKLERASKLNKKGDLYKIYHYFERIIVNLELKKDGVTVSGLLIFNISTNLVASIILGFLIQSYILMLPLFGALFYLTVTLFRLGAILKYEKREAQIMDAIDLMVSDIGDGVYNAIVKYRDSFHPNIRVYFEELIEDKRNRGYSFKAAMINLERKLGENFTSFAQKAILFEDKGDDEMVGIFSPIIERNAKKRMIRYENNIIFNAFRMQFIVSLGIVVGYVLFSLLLEPFIFHFVLRTNAGKFMLLIDIVLISWVLSYLTSLKTRKL